MLQVTPQMKVLVATEPADFRKGIDGLAAICKLELKRDPFAGTVFVFRNRRATAIKVLMYDGQGFWLCQKRLSEGKFRWWPSAAASGGADSNRDDRRVAILAAHQLQVLFSAGNAERTSCPPDWRPVAQTS